MKALCQGPGRYTVSFVYAMMVNRFSCLRFGKQIGTAPLEVDTSLILRRVRVDEGNQREIG